MKLSFLAFSIVATSSFASGDPQPQLRGHDEGAAATKQAEENDDPDVGILSSSHKVVSKSKDDSNVDENHRSEIRRLGTYQYGSGSCNGAFACSHPQESGEFVVGDYSCRENRSFLQAGFIGSFRANSNVCIGPDSCRQAALEGQFRAEDDTCYGIGACMETAYYPGGSFVAGPGSCRGEESCYLAGKMGTFTVGAGSCLGKKSCHATGYLSGSNLYVGHGSCWGDNACKEVGYGSNATIGDGSCIGEAACRRANNIFTYNAIEIGSGSCTCDGCCRDLLDGSVVGDSQCTTLAEGCSGTRVQPNLEPSPSTFPSSGPTAAPSSGPTLAPLSSTNTSLYHQDLTFDVLTNVLGLTQSDKTINLSHLVNSDTMNFSSSTNLLSLSDSNSTVDLSSLDQELKWNNDAKMLALSNSQIRVDLSGLTQDLTFDHKSNILGLTESGETVDLSHLANVDMEAQDLSFDETKNILSLSGSGTAIDLSSLQDTPELSLSENGKILEISNGSGAGVDLSSLRLTTIPVAIDNIDGKDTTSGVLEGDELVVRYGGGNGKRGWVMINAGRLVGMSISANESLKKGILEIALVDCSASDYHQLGQAEHVFTLSSDDGWLKTIHFSPPITIEAGTAVCVEANRMGTVKSEGDDDNAANVLILLEQEKVALFSVGFCHAGDYRAHTLLIIRPIP